MRATLRTALPFLLLALAQPAAAAKFDFVVNTTADHNDGDCAPLPGGDCTVFEAAEAVSDGLGKSIGFDPTVFPPGAPVVLPDMGFDIEAPDGVTIDGSGAGVISDGTGATETWAIEITSPDGEPLQNVVIRNLVIRNWELGIRIEGSDAIPAPVSRVTVDGVVVEDIEDSAGLLIQGSEISRVQIVDCAFRDLGAGSEDGIAIEASSGNVSDVAIANSTVRNANRGIYLSADDDISGIKILSSLVRLVDGTGILLEAHNGGVAGVSIADNRVGSGDDRGIDIQADDTATKISLIGNAVSYTRSGMHVAAGDPLSNLRIEKNVVSAMQNADALVLGGSSGTKAKIAGNTFGDSPEDGIDLRNAWSKVQVVGNRLVGNGEAGATVSGCTKCKFQGNEGSSNLWAFYVEGDQSQISKNLLLGNDWGIIVNGDRLKVQQNRIVGSKENGIVAGSGTTRSSFQKNVARGPQDFVDLRDDSPGAQCGSNTWKGNEFFSADPPDCIQ